MSLFFRSATTRDDAADLIPGRPSGLSGSFVEPVTTSTAPQVVAYSAAGNLLAGIVSSLPIECYTGTEDTQTHAERPAWLDDPGGQGYGLEDWLKQWVMSVVFTGNVVGQIAARDSQGAANVVVLQPPETVTYGRDGWRIDGRPIPADEVVHYRRFPIPGKRFGRSPIAAHATTFSLALSAERFGSQWFSEGAHPSQVLETDQVVQPDIADKIKARVLDTIRGSRGPAVLGAGMKLKQIQVAPEESQFLQTQGYTSAQVCRILGPGLAEILGYQSGDSQTYKNREQMALDLLAYTIDPYLVDIERVLTRLINPPGIRGQRWVAFDRNALLRTDLLTRYQAYRIALGPLEPFMVANEARRNEDALPPLPWGDERPAVQGDPTITTNPGGTTP